MPPPARKGAKSATGMSASQPNPRNLARPDNSASLPSVNAYRVGQLHPASSIICQLASSLSLLLFCHQVCSCTVAPAGKASISIYCRPAIGCPDGPPGLFYCSPALERRSGYRWWRAVCPRVSFILSRGWPERLPNDPERPLDLSCL